MLQRATKSRAGFTLVEMTVVIALLALSATLIVPHLANWREGESRRAFPSELRRLFGTAREDAIIQKGPRSIRWEEDAQAFVLVREDEETAEEIVDARVELPQGVEAVRFQSGGVEMSPVDWLVTFYPDGSAEPAAMEVQDGPDVWSLTVDSKAHTSFVQGNMPETTDERWPAGEYEQRI